jgi:hypothetical protein
MGGDVSAVNGSAPDGGRRIAARCRRGRRPPYPWSWRAAAIQENSREQYESKPSALASQPRAGQPRPIACRPRIC